MTDERIHILRDILLELHNGASPESVQDRFDATFTGVSAIEISLMEHELMNSDSGVTFEDVMELCDVHANLLKMLSKVSKFQILSIQVTQFVSSKKKIWLSVRPWFAFVDC